MGEGADITGEGGLGPKVRSSKGLRSFTLGSRLVGC